MACALIQTLNQLAAGAVGAAAGAAVVGAAAAAAVAVAVQWLVVVNRLKCRSTPLKTAETNKSTNCWCFCPCPPPGLPTGTTGAL